MTCLWEIGMFYVIISENYKRFQYFNFETGFLDRKRKPFSKNWSTISQLKALRSKTRHFHTKLPYQKSMLRQIEWWLQNGPITKNWVLPATNVFFWKLCFSFRTSCKELIWCTNNPISHICTFCKHWSFIWPCFFLWISLSQFLFLTSFQLTECLHLLNSQRNHIGADTILITGLWTVTKEIIM